MSKVRSLFVYLGLVFLCATLIVHPVDAAEFSSASLMLYRTKISQSNVQMLVVVQPSSASTARAETEIIVQFASGFSVNGSASAISVSSSGLPSTYQGHTLVAMPGIGSTATSVSGQTAHFNIGNLASGTYYAFYVTTGITTPSTIGKYVHTLSTIDGIGTIDTQRVTTNIVANDQVNVSAAVQPSTSDGNLSISGSPATSHVLERGDEATITLTYEHSLSSSQQMEVVSSWDNGYLSGSPTSQVTAVTYKVGSATNTDTGVAPVIDLTNRTITWTVPAVTPNVVHEVSFILKVSTSLSSITPEVIQNISVNGSLIDTSLATQSLTYNINFFIDEPAASVTSTPAPGSNPTATPTLTVAPTLTPFIIESVAMRTVTKDYARFILTTSKDSTYTLFYGLDQKNLSRTQVGLSFNSQHAIELSNLSPSTQYYFRIVVEDGDRKHANSDIFTFTTADSDELVTVLYGTALWGHIPLASIVDQGIGGRTSSFTEVQHIFAPSGVPLTFTFRFDKPDNISSVVLRIQNNNVLGIDSYVPSVHLSETKLLESFPGYFTGILTLPSVQGDYNVSLEVTDIAHGVRTQALPYGIHITKSLKVLDQAHGTPIEGAHVSIYMYEHYKKAFSLLEKTVSYNPTTNELGELDIALPAGQYLFEVTAPGYEKLRKEVIISIDHREYPMLLLKASTSIGSVFEKQFTSLANVIQFLKVHFGDFSSSQQVKRILRDMGIVLGLMLFLFVEYYRNYHEKISRYSKKSFVVWCSLQLVTVCIVSTVLFYLGLVLSSSIKVGFSHYYLHHIIGVILICLTYAYLHYVWKVVNNIHG